MFKSANPEVLVVGAGPVGLITALRLAESDIKVAVLDKDWRPAGFSYGLGLHPGTLSLLESLGVAGDIEQDGYRIHGVSFYDEQGPQCRLDFTALDAAHPYLTVFPQNRLEALLADALKEKGVSVWWKHEFVRLSHQSGPLECEVQRWGEDQTGYGSATKVRVIERNFTLSPQYVAGTDGHGSQVRNSLGLEFETAAPSQLFVVFEFETDYDAGGEARVVLVDDTVSVLWPLPHGRARWGFQLKPAEASGLFADRRKSRLAGVGSWITEGLDHSRLQRLVEARARWFTASVGNLAWSVPVRFEQRVVPRFGEGRLWLAGDAAHLAHPAGIHSMNMGMQEGYRLADALAAMIRGNAPGSPLEEYSQRQTAVWNSLFNTDRRLEVTAEADPFVRRNFDRFLSATPATGNDLKALLRQVGLNYHPVAAPGA